MKNHLYISLAAAAAVTLALVAPIFTNAQTVIDTEVATGIGASIDSGPAASAPQNIREALKAKIQAETNAGMKNLQNNESYRNAILESHPNLASTSAERKDIRDERIASTTGIRAEARVEMEDTSSSQERWGIRHDARIDMFKVRQNALVRQLQLSLSNLSQIRARISARIDTESANGRDMTQAKALLVIADQKMSAANDAVNSIALFDPTATTTVSVTASTTIDLARPRQIGAGAIQAVNEARKALQQVVIAIAHAMGFKIGQDGHIEATSTESATSSEQ